MDSKIIFMVAGLALLAGLLTWLPVQAGYQHAAQTNTVFTGFDFGEDSQAYSAYVRSGVDGNPLFLKDGSTSEAQDGRYVVLYFTVLALFVKFTHLGIDAAWHLFRFLIIFFLAWSVFKLSTELFNEKKSQRVFCILFLFGGGLGWMTVVFGGIIPQLGRLYSTDIAYSLGYTVFAFMFHPLAMLSLAFVIWEVIFLSRWLTCAQPNYVAFATACVLLAFFNHPASGIVGVLLAGIIFLLRLRSVPLHELLSFVFKHGKYLAAGGMVIGLYTLWARGDPVYLFHQTIYLTWDRAEPVWMYLFAMGLPLVLGVYTMLRKKFEQGPIFMILKAWFAIAFLLSLFLPAGVKYLYLVYPALVGGAVIGLNYLIQILSPRLKTSPRVLLAGLLIFMCASVPFVVEKRSSDVVEGEQFYLTRGEDGAITWLGGQTKGVVLAHEIEGRVFSWRTSQTPYLAHGFLTIDFQRKQGELRTFLDSRVPTSIKQKWLFDVNIAYVFYGPNERALGLVDSSLPLEQIYSADGVSIYRVIVS